MQYVENYSYAQQQSSVNAYQYGVFTIDSSFVVVAQMGNNMKYSIVWILQFFLI